MNAMAEQKPDWTYNEFLAFILLYAAHADFDVTREEKEILFSKVGVDEYRSIKKSFDSKNDYERLQTIKLFREDYFSDDAGIEKLLSDLKELFLADEEYNSVENAVFLGLKRNLL
jgi:hypothetical protein